MATFKTLRAKIAFDEIVQTGYPSLVQTPEGAVLTRLFRVETGSEMRAWAQDMLGWTELTPNDNYGSATGLNRYPPWSDPENYGQLWCTEVRFVEGQDGPPTQDAEDEMCVWGSVIMEATHRELDYVPSDDKTYSAVGLSHELGRYVSRMEQYKVEAQPYNQPNAQAIFQFKDSSGDKVPENPAKPVQGGVLQWIWRQIPFEFDATYGAWRLPSALRTRINAAVGSINSTAFDNSIYPAKSLYCAAPEIQWKFMANGKPAADIVYNLDRRGFEAPSNATKSAEPLWDRLLRLNNTGTNDTPVWWQIETITGGTAQGPFETYDFHNLFALS